MKKIFQCIPPLKNIEHHFNQTKCRMVSSWTHMPFLHIYFCCIVNLLDHQLGPCLSHHKNMFCFLYCCQCNTLTSLPYSFLASTACCICKRPLCWTFQTLPINQFVFQTSKLDTAFSLDIFFLRAFSIFELSIYLLICFRWMLRASY